MTRERPRIYPVSPEYALELATSGKIYKSTGQTILEALEAIPLEWEQIKAKGVITIKQGKLKHEHLFYLKPLRRIFANKLTKLMWSKRLNTLLE